MKYLRVFESIDLDPGVFHCDAGQCVSRCTQLPGRVTRQSILNGLRSLSALYSWHTLRPHQSTCSEMNGTRSLEINIRTWKLLRKCFTNIFNYTTNLNVKAWVYLLLRISLNSDIVGTFPWVCYYCSGFCFLSFKWVIETSRELPCHCW